MTQPITILVLGEVVLVLILLLVLIIASTKKSKRQSPKNVREDINQIKEQISQQ